MLLNKFFSFFSGQTAFNPIHLDPYVWVEGENTKTLSVGDLLFFIDSKMNGITFGQGTPERRPQYIATDSGYNGQPIIHLNHKSARIDTFSLNLPFPWSSYEYGEHDGTSTYAQFVGSGSMHAGLWQYVAGEQKHYAHDGVTATGPQIADAPNEKRSLYRGCRTDKTVTLIRNNGTPVVAVNSNSPVASTITTALLGHSAVGSIMPQKIAAYLIFPRELTAVEIGQLDAYFGAKYGNTPAATDADIHALVPYSWMDASEYTVDGVSGKVASFPDKVAAGTGIKASVPAHAFVQSDSAKQVVVPTALASLNNQLAANFNAAPYYTSNGAASDWRAPHDGTGFEAFVILDRTSTAASYVLYTTMTSAAGATGMVRYYSPGSGAYHVQSASTNIVSAGPAVHPLGPGYEDTTLQDTVGTDCTVRIRAASVSQVSATGAFAAGDPDHPMALGGYATTGVLPLDAKVAAYLFFNRVLTASERATVQHFIRSKYNL